jgi:predicted AlkP superfamily pyrophosphatase or phosphodiesterase
VSVLFLVIDGMPARYVGPEHAPALAALAAGGGWAREGGVAVAPSCTYPNHASFVTGITPQVHGIHANHVVDDTGVRAADTVGPTGTTLFDACRAAGRSTAAVLGDHHLVGVIRADAADAHWPPGGVLPAGIALDALGYAADEEVAARLTPVLAAEPDLVVAHLNEPDTTQHLHGPDGEAALARHRATDAVLGGLLDALRPRWDEWAVILVSDHDQETVTVDEPIDLRAAGAAAGADVTVVDEGGAALLHGPTTPDGRWLDGVDGVQGHAAFDDRRRLVWATPGRWFGAQPLPIRGVHGGPRQSAQVAVCGGGHPGVPALAASLATRRPRATDWYGTVLGLLGHGVPGSSVSP